MLAMDSNYPGNRGSMPAQRQDCDVVLDALGSDEIGLDVVEQLLELAAALGDSLDELGEALLEWSLAPLDEAVGVEQERRAGRELDRALGAALLDERAERRRASALHVLCGAVKA